MTMAQPWPHICLDHLFQQFGPLLFNSSTQFINGTKSFPLDHTSSPQYLKCPPAAPDHFAHLHVLTLQPMTTCQAPMAWQVTPPPLSPTKKPKSKLAPYQASTPAPWQQTFMSSPLPYAISSPLYPPINPMRIEP